jgi:hypothetical protein
MLEYVAALSPGAVGLPFPAESHVASHPAIPIHAAMLLHPSTHWPYRARGLRPLAPSDLAIRMPRRDEGHVAPLVRGCGAAVMLGKKQARTRVDFRCVMSCSEPRQLIPTVDMTSYHASSPGCVENASAVIRFAQDVLSDRLEYLT